MDQCFGAAEHTREKASKLWSNVLEWSLLGVWIRKQLCATAFWSCICLRLDSSDWMGMSSLHGLELEQMKLKGSILTFLCLSNTYCKNALKKWNESDAIFSNIWNSQWMLLLLQKTAFWKAKIPCKIWQGIRGPAICFTAHSLVSTMLAGSGIRGEKPQKTGAFHSGKLKIEPQHGGLEKWFSFSIGFHV